MLLEPTAAVGEDSSICHQHEYRSRPLSSQVSQDAKMDFCRELRQRKIAMGLTFTKKLGVRFPLRPASDQNSLNYLRLIAKNSLPSPLTYSSQLQSLQDWYSRTLSSVAVIMLTHGGRNVEISGNCSYPVWKRLYFGSIPFQVPCERLHIELVG